MSVQHRRVFVLRLGHRFHRDSRVTTHVCLTARALGADGIIIADVNDRNLVGTVRRMADNFGGQFQVESGKPWRVTMRQWKDAGGIIVHLTAYGIPLPRTIARLKRLSGDMLIVVGSEKVPGEVFRMADYNVAVTNQPISEVSALGIFLDWLFEHKYQENQFKNAKLRIVPTERSKKVIKS